MDPKDKTEEPVIDILKLVYLLVHRKMLTAKVCSFVAVASIVYTLMLPNIYSATAKVLPPQKDNGGLSALLGQAGGLAGLPSLGGFGGSSDVYVAILESRSLADTVIRRLDLNKVFKSKTVEDTRRHLAAAVDVQAGKDGIISVTADDKDPNLAAMLANTFVDELKRTTVLLNLSKAGSERLFLEKRLQMVTADLTKAENELKAFAERNKIVQVESQASASIEGIVRMKAELASKEVQLSVLRSSQTDQSPEVRAVATAVHRLKAQISQQSGNIAGKDGIPTVGSVPGVGLEYTRKMREVKTQESILQQLTAQYEMAKLTEAKDSSSLQVLDDAVVPINKSKPKRAQIVIIATFSAFFASLLLVLVLEKVNQMSESDKDVLKAIKSRLFSFH